MPDYAESAFQLLCDEFGASRNKAHQDRSGWDYIVDFERTVLPSTSLDEQPGSSTARVQVKSKIGGKPVVTLKLSNAGRFAREPDFCFIVLFLFDDARRNQRIYARHFHRDLMEQTLRKIREAERDGKTALNRLIIRLTFTADDEHTDDLLPWMHGICDSDPVAYAAEKQNLEKGLGYGHDAVRGTVSFGDITQRDLVDHMIGLKPSIPVERITLTKKRFGITSSKPFIDERPASASFTVNPLAAKLILETESGDAFEVEGELRKFGLPGIPGGKASFLSDAFRMVIESTGTVDLDYSLKYETAYPLQLLNLMSGLLVNREQGTAYLQEQGKNAVEVGSFSLRDCEDAEWYRDLALITSSLCRCQPSETKKFLLRAIMESKDRLFYFSAASQADTISLREMKEVNAVPEDAKLRYFVLTKIEDLTFFQIVERSFDGIEIEPDSQLYAAKFGPPSILDAGTALDPIERLEKRLRRKLQAIHKQSAQPTISFTNGGFTPDSLGLLQADFTHSNTPLEFSPIPK